MVARCGRKIGGSALGASVREFSDGACWVTVVSAAEALGFRAVGGDGGGADRT